MEINKTNGDSFQNSWYFSPKLELPDISLSISGIFQQNFN